MKAVIYIILTNEPFDYFIYKVRIMKIPLKEYLAIRKNEILPSATTWIEQRYFHVFTEKRFKMLHSYGHKDSIMWD